MINTSMILVCKNAENESLINVAIRYFMNVQLYTSSMIIYILITSNSIPLTRFIILCFSLPKPF